MKVLPFDVACRVWDGFAFDGISHLFRVALAILRMCQPMLLNQPFEDCLQLLTLSGCNRYIYETVGQDSGFILFKAIDCVVLSSSTVNAIQTLGNI